MGKPADPFRIRRYLHFDEPLPRSVLKNAVLDPAQVAVWQFLPLIRAEVIVKKLKKKLKTGAFVTKTKTRPICYASHKDTALYGLYGSRIAMQYEAWLHQNGLTENVTAFRPACGKCNIHYAFEAFHWIANNGPVVALAYDISSFFDSLDHLQLKHRWAALFGRQSLLDDEFAIYRSLTRARVVDRASLYEEFGISKNNPRARGRKRICNSAEFRERVVRAGLLEGPQPKGIPQGTAISAILSNVYMMDFDRKVAAAAAQCGGLFRRYCDDILCVVPKAHEASIKALVADLIEQSGLEIQTEKMDRVEFDPGSAPPAKPLQYLGLMFDGHRVLLRPSGIGRYYSRMRAGVRQAGKSRRAEESRLGMAKNSIPIRRKTLNELYSYLGSRNFLSYASRAAKITGHNEIRKQVSRHWLQLEAAVKREDR